MKSVAFVFLCLIGMMSLALAKPYDLPSEHLHVNASDDWKVTTESDELFGVTNADGNSFTITVNPVGKQIDIQSSTLPSNNEAALQRKGMQIVKEEKLSFHSKDAVAILAKMNKSGYTLYMYEIITTQGDDVVTFIMVGERDPSRQPNFQAILDTVTFDAPAAPAPAK